MGFDRNHSRFEYGVHRWNRYRGRSACHPKNLWRNGRSGRMGHRRLRIAPLLPSCCLRGALGDLYGQRKIFGLGTYSCFALSSSRRDFAPSILQLLIARSAQGASGACLVANSLAFLNSSDFSCLTGTSYWHLVRRWGADGSLRGRFLADQSFSTNHGVGYSL